MKNDLREKAAKILRDFIYASTKHPGCEYVALDELFALRPAVIWVEKSKCLTCWDDVCQGAADCRFDVIRTPLPLSAWGEKLKECVDALRQTCVDCENEKGRRFNCDVCLINKALSFDGGKIVCDE
jgi:hypothetical protein